MSYNNRKGGVVMKQKWMAFYNSKWFIPTIVIAFMVVGTVTFYALFEHFHLWFGLLLILGFIVVIKIITFIINGLINLIR